jgi:hypothetical protein
VQTIGFPPVEKDTVPVGPLGVIVTPPRVAVRVTGMPAEALGDVSTSVGLSLFTVCVVEALAGLAL